MTIIPDHSSDSFVHIFSMEDISEITRSAAIIELQIGQSIVRISNHADQRLLKWILKFMGNLSC